MQRESPKPPARIGYGAWPVFVRACRALFVLVSGLLVLTDARAATPGITIDRIDLTLEIPDPEKDAMLQTKHTLVLHTQSASLVNRLPLAVAPLTLTAKELGSGAPVTTSRRVSEEEGFTDVVIPSGAARTELVFTTPLFDSAIPRFWWDETQVVLGWPFAAAVQPLTQGMQVTVLGPAKLGRAPGFACVSDPDLRVRCSRFFGPAELARYTDSRDKGMVVASILGDPMPAVVSAAQIGLWALLVFVVGFARALRNREKRMWIFLRSGLAVALFVPCSIGFALLVDGETDGPLAASMSWAAGVLGVTALFLAHVDNRKRPIRTRLAQVLLAGAFPLAVLVVALARSSPAALWCAGGLAFTAFLVMFGENSE